MNAALEFEGFSFRYPNSPQEKPLLGPLDFALEEDSFTLITGPTGCGKTTLLRSCKPELAPQGVRQGSIRLFGADAAHLTIAESARTVGFVTQNAENQVVCSEPWHELAFGLENLGTPQETMRRRVAELAHFFGINSWLHQDVNSLSGGQTQLLALASVMACAPRILLLDEPTSQLDPVAAHSLAHALFRMSRELGVTIVVTTHAPELLAPYATQRFELANGTLTERPLPSPTVFVPATCPQPKETVNAPALCVDDAHFRYQRKSPFVLKGCDLAVQEGSLHAVVGGNGCGKSTLLALAAGTLRPERGCITSPYRAAQGFIPQDPKALFVCDSVLEELQDWQKACGYRSEDIAGMLCRLHLEGLENAHPFDLSGGQQQLLAFAKVLLTRPRLLLLDEATKGLDAQTKLMVANLCRSLTKAGTTIVLATHDLTFAACAADSVTMLFDGESACTEPPAQFFKNNLFYRATANAFTEAWEQQ